MPKSRPEKSKEETLQTKDLVYLAALTDRQRRFVQEYMTDWNATQAAIRAGYSEETARVIGSENLSKPAIQALIQQHLESLGLNAERVLAEQAAMAFLDPASFVDILPDGSIKAKSLNAIPPQARRAIRKIKMGKDGLELELYDRQKALDILGKHLSGRERLTPPLSIVQPGNGQPAQQVVGLIAQAIGQTQTGQLDPVISKSIATLAMALLKANEQGELEQRLAALESALKSQNSHDDTLDIDL